MREIDNPVEGARHLLGFALRRRLMRLAYMCALPSGEIRKCHVLCVCGATHITAGHPVTSQQKEHVILSHALLPYRIHVFDENLDTHTAPTQSLKAICD
jgi:hypothetical protein